MCSRACARRGTWANPATSIWSSTTVGACRPRSCLARAGRILKRSPAAGRRDIGQIFTADSPFVLDRLTLQLQSGTGVGAKAAPFRLTVFEWDRAAKKITRTLGTFEGTMPAVVSPANTYLSFDLGDQKPALEAGATYGFLLSFEEPLDARALSLQSSNENAGQPSVRRVESADGQTLQVSPWVLEFYLQGTAK